MGKKAKLGKRRKDKFYHLAKETGYRARSAFKLVQLNRKYNFLQSSRVVIDLCAAPGGWLQVAAQSMPVSSLIVGVDLVPIKSIPNVITIQEDITTARCKQLLQRELKTWKADCVLNDGAPNVGAAWVQDAFSQAELSLAALKLACAFLREGGWFITKVFRSKDYQSLMWVLQQLFKKVHATKPQASRSESAEIFVVCQGYLAPSSLDEKLLDPKYVFQEVEVEKDEEKVSLAKLQKPSKSAEGYPDDARVLFKSVPVSDFIMSDNHLSVLRQANQLLFDRTSEVFARHPLTTEEVKENCCDLKVLGARELKQLVKWRERMRGFMEEVGSEGEEGGEGGEEEEGEGEEEGLEGVDDKVKRLASKESAEVKREIRHLRKQRKKLKERLVVKGGVAEETGELIRQEHLFQLRKFKTGSGMGQTGSGAAQTGSGAAQTGNEVGEEEEGWLSEDERENDSDEGDSGEEEIGEESEGEVEEEGEMEGGESEEEEEEEGGAGDKEGEMDVEKEGEGEEEEMERGERTGVLSGEDSDSDDSDFEEVPAQKLKRKLDPEGLAIGALLVQSKKKREDLIESGYNRWTSNDDSLPDWFEQDEAKFCHKQLPITKEMVEVYRAKLKEIDSRPIKKIAEAKARKKKRAVRSLERARKKAESITDAADISAQEKAQQIKQIYKKAGALGKKKRGNIEYVVAKRGVGKRVSRPAGVKGRFKVVDPRMKKDSRGKAKNEGRGKKQKRARKR